ncbi:MAG: DUF4340 domain-containing protein [Bacteroidetes bacterium]|nr:DUF4340 domain-containing protein [Bacteroidota bacterium]
MFKKMNFRILIIVFLVLLAVVLISKYVDSRRGERTFKKELVQVDMNDITAVLYNPDPKTPDEVKIVRDGGQWKVFSGDKVYRADSSMVAGIITSLINLKPERVAATDESKWKEFKVDDTSGTLVTLLKGEDVIASLIIGKFSYTPQPSQNPYQKQQGKMTSYVRLKDDKVVYAVDGFLKFAFQKDANALRDKGLVRTKKEDIIRLAFNYPGDSSFTLTRQGNSWMVNGQVCDSVKTVRYLATVARLSSGDLLDETNVTPGYAQYTVTIEANNMNPIELKAIPADTVNKFIITSSLNPGAYFSGGKNKLFNKIFVSSKNFLPVQ